MPLTNVKFIIAEDDRDDQVLIMDALMENGVTMDKVRFVDNGEELIVCLRERPNQHNLILLDLNMPRLDGREALKRIRDDRELCHIPVIVFTTSNAENDIRLAYELGSNTFITKPSSYRELVEVMGIIKEYWFEKAKIVRFK